MQKNLNVRFSTETKNGVVSKVFTIVVDTDGYSSVTKFISWVNYTNHGSFDENGDIECDSLIDYVGCQKMALTLGLLPKLPLSCVWQRFCVYS